MESLKYLCHGAVVLDFAAEHSYTFSTSAAVLAILLSLAYFVLLEYRLHRTSHPP